MKDPISAAEIQRAQSTMGLIGRMAESVDWSAYIETVGYAEIVAPFLDPTAYIRSPHQLRAATTELARMMAGIVVQWKKCRAELDASIERYGEDQ
jgi:hypothetical protein